MKNIVCVLCLILVAACSSTPTREQIAADQARAERVRASSDEEQMSRRQARNEAELAQVPAWAVQPPLPDATGIYAVGIAQSADMRIAARKAALDAEFGLAKLYNQELSGSERSFTQEQGAQVSRQYTALIDKLVTQVPVVGFETVKQEVRAMGGEFHAFVLLKLPFDEFNRVIQQQRAQAKNSWAIGAFDDLERRVQSRQEQRAKEHGASSVADSPPSGATTAVGKPLQPLPID